MEAFLYIVLLSQTSSTMQSAHLTISQIEPLRLVEIITLSEYEYFTLFPGKKQTN